MIPYGFPMTPYGFGANATLVSGLISHGFPMIPYVFGANATPMIGHIHSRRSAYDYLWISCGFPVISPWISYVFPMAFLHVHVFVYVPRFSLHILTCCQMLTMGLGDNPSKLQHVTLKKLHEVTLQKHLVVTLTCRNQATQIVECGRIGQTRRTFTRQ